MYLPSLGEIADVVIAVSAIYGAWKGRTNEKSIREVHLMVNSRMSEFLSTVRQIAHAAGVKEQQDKDKKDENNVDPR